MKSDAWLFVGIIVFLFVVWVAEGGPSRPLSFAGPVTGGFALATSSQATLSAASTSLPTTSQISENLSEANSQVVSLEESLSEAADFGNPSPYKDLITLSHNITPLANDNADEQYLTLNVSNRAPASGIDITGWRIEGHNESYSLPFPAGVTTPELGAVNAVTPITLLPGQTAIVSVGDSPIGVSFLENECTGYFDQFQSFTPPLAHECPYGSTDFANLSSDANHNECESYIETIPRCTVPFNFPRSLSASCEQFAESYLNYNACASAHADDVAFPGDEWRIYLGQANAYFTHEHDVIKLLDRNGDTVDLLSY